jgi:hypothetical protein
MIRLRTAAAQLDTAVNIAFHAITHRFGLAISDVHWVAAMGRGMCRVSEGRERTTVPAGVVGGPRASASVAGHVRGEH